PTEENVSSGKEIKFDMDSVSPEILQMIIKHLGIKDRCKLRVFSSLEEAISQSLLDLSRHELSVIDLQARHGNIVMQFGETSYGERLMAPKGSENELLRLRKRLFKRASVKQVKLSDIDFNVIPVSFIEDFLDGCSYDRLLMTITGREYNESVCSFLNKHNREIELTMEDFYMDSEALLALEPMRKLVIRVMFGSEEIPLWEDEEGTTLALVKKRHTILDVTLSEFKSSETILEIFTLVADFDRSQCVIFNISFHILNQFMQHIGYRRASYDQKFEDRFENARNEQPIEIVHDELLSGRWSGEFELSYHGGTMAIRADVPVSCTWINTWRIIVHNESFDRRELGKEYISIKEREMEANCYQKSDEQNRLLWL
ncbi:hypothetical protein PFISCL1PPCAC_16477, partial [Pristionchus fissidentatus]